MQLVQMDTGGRAVRRVHLSPGQLRIGRDPSLEVCLAIPTVATIHARLEVDESSCRVERLTPAHTAVNGEAIPQGQLVRVLVGDVIDIGGVEFRVVEDRRTTADDDAQALLAIEEEIHRRFIDRLETHRPPTTSGEAYEHHVSLVLDQIVTDYLPRIASQAGKHVILMALKKRIQQRVLAPEKRDTPRVEELPLILELDRMVDGFIQEMALTGDPRRVKDDLVQLDRLFPQVVDADRVSMSAALQRYLMKMEVFLGIRNLVLGYGPLEEFLAFPHINEVMVVGKDKIYIEKSGSLENTRRSFLSDKALRSVIERIVGPVGRRVDTGTPLADARLLDGSRVNIVIEPLSLKGPSITIRRFPKFGMKMKDLVERGALNDKVANFFRGCVIGRKNIVVSGGTGSGKTTLLNVLSSFIPSKERIVTIEDAAELQLMQEHVVSLETRPANVEGKGEYTIRDLVKNALRMRPDRIVVGECRGGEALDMLQAMNTGHAGSMTTAHANSPRDLLLRLETMVLMAVDMPVVAIRQQIAAAIDVVIQLNRLDDGSRRVTEVCEVMKDVDEETGRVVAEPVFVFRHARGTLVKTGYLPSFLTQFLEKKILTTDAEAGPDQLRLAEFF